MTLAALFGLFMATVIFALTPGPGTLAVISRGLALGFGPAFLLGVGLTLGDLIYLWAAMLSLGFIAEQAESVFQVVRYVGGAYLIYLGYTTFRSPPPSAEVPDVKTTGWMRSLIAGCAISCTNPKVILFYLGFLPVFLDLKTLTTADMLAVTVVIEIALLLVLFGIAAGAHRVRPMLAKSAVGVWINRVSGGVMASVGVAVASN